MVQDSALLIFKHMQVEWVISCGRAGQRAQVFLGWEITGAPSWGRLGEAGLLQDPEKWGWITEI